MNFARASFMLAGFLALQGTSFSQETPQFIRMQCVKVIQGKGAEFETYLKENRKLAKVRIDQGSGTFSIVSRAVYPSGREARCDYHFVAGFNGFPPEASTAQQTEADMKKAGITLTRAQYNAKQSETSYLVEQQLWRSRGSVGNVPMGGYVRINYEKIKPGMAADWLKWELEWKDLAESAAKDIPGTSWGLYTLSMPGGSDYPVKGMTVDGFPSWEAVGKGLPAPTIWKKVHPDTDYAQHMGKLSGLSDRSSVEVFKVVDIIRK